jgi:hypothetical protein
VLGWGPGKPAWRSSRLRRHSPNSQLCTSDKGWGPRSRLRELRRD